MSNNERLKILMKQFQEMRTVKDMQVFFPNKANPTLWHVSFLGPKDTPFERGVYHVQLDLSGYPESGPDIQILHENGGYRPHANLCIQGLTRGNQSTWTPGTAVSAICTAVRSYMVGDDRSGSNVLPLEPDAKIRKHAEDSLKFACACGADHAKLQLARGAE